MKHKKENLILNLKHKHHFFQTRGLSTLNSKIGRPASYRGISTLILFAFLHLEMKSLCFLVKNYIPFAQKVYSFRESPTFDSFFDPNN